MSQILLLALVLLISLKTKFRIIFALIAPVVVLGNQNVTSAKIIYIILLVLINILCQVKIPKSHLAKIFNQIRLVNVLILILIGTLIIVGTLENHSSVEIFRSSIVFVIFLLNYRLIVSSYEYWTIDQARILIYVLGIIGAASTFYTWIQRRGILIFSSDRIGLDADYFAILAICLSIYYTNTNTNTKSIDKTLNSILISITALLLLATLSRTYIVLLLSTVLIALGKSKGNRLRQFSVTFQITILVVGVVFLLLSSLDSTKIRIVQSRIFDSFSLISGNKSTNNLSYLESINDRRQQAKLAYEIWKSSPFFGSAVLPSQYTFDSIIATLAKFGIFGAIVILIIFGYLNKASKNLPKGNTIRSGIQTAILVILIPSSIIGNWPENKSIWLICNLIFFLILVEGKELATKESKL